MVLLADRFYGTPEMIRWCRDRGWDYRLRLKSNLIARLGATRTTTGALALSGGHYFERVALTGKRVTTNHRHYPRPRACRTLDHRHSKRADRVKMLVYDGTGLVLIWKRLEGATFKWPPVNDGVMRLSAAQLAALFEGADWRHVHVPQIARPQLAG